MMEVATTNRESGIRVSPSLPEIAALVKRMREGPTVELPLSHRFTPGLYIRELRVPAGVLVVTKIHHTEHPWILSKGRIAVWTEEKGVEILEAPASGVTKPGTIRLAIALGDVVWTTFHATTETDVEKLEKELVSDPVELMEQPEGKVCLLEQ